MVIGRAEAKDEKRSDRLAEIECPRPIAFADA